MSARALSREMAAAKALKSALEQMSADDETVRDMIEGETGLHEAIARVMASVTDDEIIVVGITEIEKSLSVRKERISLRISRKQSAIAQAMDVGGLKTLHLPEATITLRQIKPKIIISDERKIPERFFIPQPSKLDKRALNDAVDAGEDVPGTEMSNGAIGLIVRRK